MPKNITVNYSQHARQRAQELIGRNLPDEHLAALAGALDEAMVDIAAREDSCFSILSILTSCISTAI